MINYFSTLFKASEIEWEYVVDCIHTSISTEQNDNLLRAVSKQKVKNALFHMHPDKSPSPDGLSFGFYQKYWSIVGDDVTRLVQRFFETGAFDAGVIETNIVLVPKKQCPRMMADLRPISLCDVVYKVVAKVIANRLKDVIGQVISKTRILSSMVV